MRRALALIAALVAAPVFAQPNGIVLIAKPGSADPNFSETVVLVTRSDEGSTVGVVLNRPQTRTLAEIAPRFRSARSFKDSVYTGGPVLREVVVALYRAASPPTDAAFEVLPGVYLTLHPRNIEAVLAAPPKRLRIFAGFSGWAPQQLEAEIAAGGWYVLRASEEVLFRRDTATLWSELVEKARGARTQSERDTQVAARLTNSLTVR